MLESEIADPGDTKLIKEFENESQQTKTESSLEVISAPPPREALITTAINFLQNERIRKSPINQKHKFLKSKGLTNQEIQIACERAGVFSENPNSTVIEMDVNTQQSRYLMAPRPSALARIKDVLQSMALVSGLAYACYLFYKKYIEPFLFGRKKKTVEETLVALEEKLEKKIGDLNKEVTIVKETVVSTSHTDDISQKLHGFKNDLDAIKGLLLNRFEKNKQNKKHTKSTNYLFIENSLPVL
ncbi:PEX14 family protein [Megaselia abdita]